MVVLNHLSCDPTPSKADLDFTCRIIDLDRLADITLKVLLVIGSPLATSPSAPPGPRISGDTHVRKNKAFGGVETKYKKELAVVTTASFALVWTMAKDGCRNQFHGCRNQFHGCRILASAELYKARKAKAIIVSSDNYVKGYVAVARAVCEGRGIN